jgi:hypothetical protein
MLCVLCIFKKLFVICEENIYELKVWNLLLELVCVCVKMVGHKRKTLLPLGTKPLYLGITMAWGLRMCEEE